MITFLLKNNLFYNYFESFCFYHDYARNLITSYNISIYFFKINFDFFALSIEENLEKMDKKLNLFFYLHNHHQKMP